MKVNPLKEIRDKAKGLTAKLKAPTEDMVFAVRDAIEDLDTKTFQEWYTALDPTKQAHVKKLTSTIKEKIDAKARQRTDARIVTAGRKPSALTEEEYNIIFEEELDELKNSLKKGALEGALGLALATMGINIWF